jgi:predicted DNA-binding transcriptional regulator AlpA
MDSNHNDKPPRLLSKKEVLARIPVTGPTLWNWIRQGKFPCARYIADNKTGWLESEVNDWINARPERAYKSPT